MKKRIGLAAVSAALALGMLGGPVSAVTPRQIAFCSPDRSQVGVIHTVCVRFVAVARR